MAGQPSEEPEASRGHRLDEVVPDTWPSEAVSALDGWKQGDIVAGCPLFWAGTQGDDAALGISGADTAWRPLDGAEDGDTGWVMITSQTCDVALTGPGAHHPFVDVSPVYALRQTTGPFVEAIATGKVTYLRALTSPPAPGLHVVDLRLSIPASKGLLINPTPISGWANERDQIDFAEHIAARLRRPALHDAVSGPLVASLDQHIAREHRGEPEWWQHVEQVRVRMVGDRLSPTAVTLLVCCEVPLTPAQKEVWRSWRRPGAKILKPSGIALHPTLFFTLDEMPARMYRDSIPLRLPALGRTSAW